MRHSNGSAPDLTSTAALPASGVRPRHAWLVDVDGATRDLLALWLGSDGWQLRTQPQPGERPDLIVVELAYPRHRDRERLLLALDPLDDFLSSADDVDFPTTPWSLDELERSADLGSVRSACSGSAEACD